MLESTSSEIQKNQFSYQSLYFQAVPDVVGFLTQRSELSDLVEVFVLSLAAAAAAALHGE